MKFKATLLCLASALLLPSLANAKPSCTIESFEPIDIAPETRGGVFDKESGQFLVTQKPMMRCANITFTTAHTRNRVAHLLTQNFEAGYFDGKTGQSHSVTFDEDELEAGYIR
ncbi:hypothetical protein NB545_06540, partial [Vibrio campbellii]